MNEKPLNPTVNANVVEVAQERFKTAVEAREALHKAVDEISDDLLRYARGVQILVMA
ncbi:hypothetical protein SAMN05421805_102512 [Saccharopolyspora antimicrobica]|uniref:Uncharacterized protein n=1 Tax=Saccharopolyspora antimicrobica TaxID=455193 RepID=A0A1I4W2T4_9PSEU|nr:hypothetical protein [Saccharopolyspora antimicrobica]RKT87086.1 hypothetical protein ATL45_5474 [Saccharopolyspora antimicrobica]SFN07934.1 hypothetical protein SAMN05421805_102512 [Saccharopolyspora antimicrobica]